MKYYLIEIPKDDHLWFGIHPGFMSYWRSIARPYATLQAAQRDLPSHPAGARVVEYGSDDIVAEQQRIAL